MEKLSICVVGLGYVGMPLAYEFAKKFDVVGYDRNEQRINELKSGYDRTNELSKDQLAECTARFTTDPAVIAKCNFIVVAVPTPITQSKHPDFSPLVGASEVVGRYLQSGAIIVYESTVHPGATEEICQPILEKESGMKCGEDFKIAYSPERINPGDKVNTLTKIKKIVSGMDGWTLEVVASAYESIIEAGVFRAASIKVAEAAKIVENTQRDLNIALMNELAIIFDRMNIRTTDVLEAAGTKWNFLKFSPGLVGGHCIGVDPYYLTEKSATMGYTMDIILAARALNESVSTFVAEKTVRLLAKSGRRVVGSRILIMGFTFKEDVSDIRNSKVSEIATYLSSEWNVQVDIHDPVADVECAEHEYGQKLCAQPEAGAYDAVVLAVPHAEFKAGGVKGVLRYLKPETGVVLVDVKSVFSPRDVPEGVQYWSL